jgi:nondiscriminating aspartyl-tRNA synthetase
MRVLSDEAKDHVGKKVHVEGWLHKKRLLGGLTFINVRDRRGLLQVVLSDKDEVEKLRGLQIGTVLAVDGTVVEEPRAPGGAELHDAVLSIMVPVTAEPPIEIDKPIDHKADNLDTLFEYRTLNVRNLTEQKIFRIRASILQSIRNYLTDHEFVEIQTPKLIGGSTEGGAEVFKLDYFGQEATLAQSPQFYKQIMVGAFERVFEIAPAYRAEPSATTRHMSEVMMLDVEMGFVGSHDEVLDVIGDMTLTALHDVYKSHAEDLRALNAPELLVTDKVPKITVAKIHELYSQATGTDTTKEKDLIPDEERFICDYAKKELGSELIFATHFPVEAMKFYHQVNPEDPTTVMWADLLFRGLEIATCPLREYHYEKLIEQMKKASLDIDKGINKYYVQAFKYGLPQHGGCGFGIDRLVQKTIGLGNIKEATLFPRDINRLTP